MALKTLQEKGQLRSSSGSVLVDKLANGIENAFVSLFRVGTGIFDFALTHPYAFVGLTASLSIGLAYYYGLYQAVLNNVIITRTSVETLTKTVREEQDQLRQMVDVLKKQITDSRTLNDKIVAVADSHQSTTGAVLNTLKVHDVALENMTERFGLLERSLKLVCEREEQLEKVLKIVSEQVTPLEQLIILLKANPALVSHLSTLTSEQHMAAIAAVIRTV